ncbi:MAG: hypothetical protein LBQ57_04270, partial [Spirochaetales bacterium]|nr:hypothetical protein [Spirochaetales bacterium]
QGIEGARATVLCKDAYKIALQFFRSGFYGLAGGGGTPEKPGFLRRSRKKCAIDDPEKSKRRCGGNWSFTFPAFLLLYKYRESVNY